MTTAEPTTNPRFARVLIDRSIQRELDYAIPDAFAGKIGIGSRIRVPFRERSALATVVGLLKISEATGIRSIEALVGDAPILSEKLIELGRWMSVYYSPGRGELEEAIVCQRREGNRSRRDRKTAKARTEAGATARGGFEIGRSDSGRPIIARECAR
jgi:primosomal protein N'